MGIVEDLSLEVAGICVSTSKSAYMTVIAVNIRCCGILVIASTTSDATNDRLVNRTVTYSLHHGQMFQVVVRLEEGIAGEKLDEDATYAPDVAWKAPSKVKDDLGRPVVSGRYDRRMIFILKGR